MNGRQLLWPVVALAITLQAWVPATAQRLAYPVTKKIDHVDDYFGTKVADPYR